MKVIVWPGEIEMGYRKKKKGQKRKGRKSSEFFIFWKLKFEMNLDRINLGILRPCPP